jgi:hypothetical protein
MAINFSIISFTVALLLRCGFAPKARDCEDEEQALVSLSHLRRKDEGKTKFSAL